MSFIPPRTEKRMDLVINTLDTVRGGAEVVKAGAALGLLRRPPPVAVAALGALLTLLACMVRPLPFTLDGDGSPRFSMVLLCTAAGGAASALAVVLWRRKA